MKYKLLVVTVTYKPEISDLYGFIDSFEQYNDLGKTAKLVVVDNSPVAFWNLSGTKMKYPNVTFVENPENPGFGASNNIGFNLFKSDYVLFMNNDTEFVEPVFEKLIELHEADVKIGCIGIHQLGGSPSFFKKMTTPKGIDNAKFTDQYHFISGAFMFFKSAAFEKCGKFDENLFMYFEEFDISTRLSNNGFYTEYVNNLSFLHKVGNRRQINETTWKRAIPSFCYICRKYDLDPKAHSKPIMKRLIMLFFYNCLLLHFREALKIWNVYIYRKRLIYKEFGVRI